MAKKKTTGAEILKQDVEEQVASVKAMVEAAAPATPLEAAIDKATGFADAAKADVTEEAEGFSEKEKAANRPGTEKADSETKQAKDETEQAKDETEQAKDETEQAESETKRGDSETKKRDWVEEAYKCFIKDAGDIDPTDPVKAVEAYFQKNATDELKARCKAEGKDAKGCWRFVEAVARKALHGSSGHIDPAVVYAIAMHWFEDVPADWDAPAKAPARQAKTKTEKKAKPKKPTETPSEIRKEKERQAKAKAKAKAKKPKQQQGFFFEMLETPVEGGQEK